MATSHSAESRHEHTAQRGPDGVWREAVPLGPQGLVAKVEFWLRRRGRIRLAGLLARWDERGL